MDRMNGMIDDWIGWWMMLNGRMEDLMDEYVSSDKRHQLNHLSLLSSKSI